MLNFKHSLDIVIGLFVAPLLVSLVGAKALAELMQGLGQTSEELFRGDRLPVLHLTSPAILDPENRTE